ncbi:MAG: hypothetical protein WCL44_02710 [bacterium]
MRSGRYRLARFSGLVLSLFVVGAAGCDDEKAPATYTLSNTPPVAGLAAYVAPGSDPDVAVDSKGDLHLAYVRAGAIWYTKFDYESGTVLVPEILVGGGDDPQIEVDSKDNPHIVFGNVYYASWIGNGFTPPIPYISGRGRPRITIDSQDRVYVAGMRTSGPRDKLFMFKDNALLINGLEVGGNDLGGIDADESGRVHIVWRSGRSLYYSTYGEGDDVNGINDRSLQISGYASDFSDITVDERDGSLHVCHTHSFGGGIDYLNRSSDGVWSTDTFHASGQCLDAADFTQPTITVDRDGYKYIAFTGDHFIPKYFVIGRDGAEIVGTSDIDPAIVSGPKKQNPNVASRPDMSGAYAAWGQGMVYVRPLGTVSF